MKKDIQIPKTEHVSMAIVKEYNSHFKTDDWNAYLINNSQQNLDTVLIVSKGSDQESGKETAVLRHKIDVLPGDSFAKIELIQDDVLKLTNTFQITFFVENNMYEKTFVFEKGAVNEGALRMLPKLNKRGVELKY